MASTIPGWDDMLTNLSTNGTSSLSGGDYTQNLSPEELAQLQSFFKSTPYMSVVETSSGGDGGPTYNNRPNYTDVGSRTFGQLSGGTYSTLVPGQDNLYANYGTSGEYQGASSVSNDFMDKFGRALPYITGAALGGIAAFGGAAAGAGAGAAAGSGAAAGVGAGTLGATEAAGAGGMSTANTLGSTFANATGTGIDGLLATNGAYGTASGGGGLSSLFSNGLTARTAIQGASSLYDMYAKNKMAKAQQDLLSQNQQQINNLYAPGSPEYNLLAEKIARSNAAAGRNSQVGQFASTLAGTIADAKLRASSGALPAQSSLLNSSLGNQYGGLSSLFFNLMNQGKQ